MRTICFFNSVKSWGGGEKWHFDTSIYLHNKGYKVLVVTHKESELSKKLKNTGIHCIGVQVGNLSFLNQNKVKAVKTIFQNNNVGCVVINLSRDLKLAGLAAKKAGVGKVVYRRGSAIPIKNTILNRYYFKNIITYILVNSNATKDTVLVNNPSLFPEHHIKVIYNGLDIDGFLNKAYKPIYLSDQQDETVLVNLGRLEFQKNQKFLMLLAAELKKRALTFKILIGGEGRLKDSLVQMRKELGVENEVILCGFIDNPKAIIHSGDIFLLPSLWEGFGYVLAEAGLCKKPVVAFDTSSNPEIVLNGKTGYLTAVDDVIAFADKVEKLIQDPQLRNKMGQEAFNYVQNTFDAKIVLAKIEEYLVMPTIENKLTALLITFNEIDHIVQILQNIQFADEIIVVDSYSTDGTVEKIKGFKNVKLIQRKFKNYTDQKSFAMEQATHDWVLFLDADERVTPVLENEILNTLNCDSSNADAYYFRRTFMFKDKVLHFSGWQSDKNYRLFRKSKTRFAKERIVHETLIVEGKSEVLKNKLIHYSYKNYEDYKGKMIKYGQMKALEEYQKDYMPNSYHFVLRPFYKFFNHYILRLGILDGKKGVIICYLNALGVYSRYKELKRLRKVEENQTSE